MWLFCVVFNDVVKQLSDDGFEVCAYADDLVTKVMEEQDIPKMVKYCDMLCSNIGLEINYEKCESTANGNLVEFM